MGNKKLEIFDLTKGYMYKRMENYYKIDIQEAT